MAGLNDLLTAGKQALKSYIRDEDVPGQDKQKFIGAKASIDASKLGKAAGVGAVAAAEDIKKTEDFVNPNAIDTPEPLVIQDIDPEDTSKPKITEATDEEGKTITTYNYALETKEQKEKRERNEARDKLNDERANIWGALKGVYEDVRGMSTKLEYQAAQSSLHQDAQEKVWNEYYNDVSDILKKPRQTMAGDLLAKLKQNFSKKVSPKEGYLTFDERAAQDPETRMSHDEFRAQEEEAYKGVYDPRVMQNVGYHNTIKNLNTLMGGIDDRESPRYKFEQLSQQLSPLTVAFENGEISQEEFSNGLASLESQIKEVEKYFNDHLGDKKDVIPKGTVLGIDDIIKLVGVSDAYEMELYNLAMEDEFKVQGDKAAEELGALLDEEESERAEKDIKYKNDMITTMESQNDKNFSKLLSENVEARKQETVDGLTWEGHPLSYPELQSLATTFKTIADDKTNMYKDSIQDLMKQRERAEVNGYDGHVEYLDDQIRQVEGMATHAMNSLTAYAKYTIDNVGRPGFTDQSLIEYQFDKNTPHSVADVVMYQGKGSWVTKDSKVSEIVQIASTRTRGLNLADDFRTMGREIGGMFTTKDNKSLGENAQDVWRGFQHMILDARGGVTSAAGVTLNEINTYAFRPVLQQVFNFDYTKDEGFKKWEQDKEADLAEATTQAEKDAVKEHYDNIKPRRTQSWFDRANEPTISNMLEHPTVGSAGITRATSQLKQIGPDGVQIIAEIILMKKLGSASRFMTTPEVVQEYRNIQKSSRFMTQLAKDLQKAQQVAGETERITEIKKVIDAASKTYKSSNLSTKKKIFAMSNLLEQSVGYSAMFQPGRTTSLTDEEVAMDIFFASTFDLLDTIKATKGLGVLDESNFVKILEKDSRFIDNYAIKTNGFTHKEWRNLSADQRNIFRSEARGTVTMTYYDLQKFRQGLSTNDWNNMKATIAAMGEFDEAVLENMTKRGHNVADEFFANLNKSRKELDNAKVQKAIEEEVQATAKAEGITEEEVLGKKEIDIDSMSTDELLEHNINELVGSPEAFKAAQADMLEKFSNYSIAASEAKDMIRIMFASKGDPAEFIKLINDSKLSVNLKKYWKDVLDPQDFIAKGKNTAQTVYERNIEKLAAASNVDPNQMKIMVDTYLNGEWKTMKGYISKLKKAGIDTSWLGKNEAEIKRASEYFTEATVKGVDGKATTTLKQLHLDKTKKAVQGGVTDTATTSALSKAYDEIYDNIVKLSNDPKVKGFLDKLKGLEPEEQIRLINAPGNEKYKEVYYKLEKLKFTAFKMLDDVAEGGKINYKMYMDEMRSGQRGLATDVYKEKFGLYGSKFEDETFQGKAIDGKIYDVETYLSKINKADGITPTDIQKINYIKNNLYDLMSPDYRKVLNGLVSGKAKDVPLDKLGADASKTAIDNADDAIEAGKSREDIIQELDSEILSIESRIETQKRILKITDEQLLEQDKRLNGYSTKLARSFLPQSKDYFGDAYFKDATKYRNIFNLLGKLTDGSTLKKRIGGELVVKKNKVIKKNELFREDVVRYSKNKTFNPKRATPEYIEQVKSAHAQIVAIHSAIVGEFGPKLGSNFVNGVRDNLKNLDVKYLETLGNMMEHGDFMEFIRNSDKKLFSLLSDYEFSHKIRGAPESLPKRTHLLEQYKRKYIYALNTLSHNSLTVNQSKVLNGAKERALTKTIPGQWVKKGRDATLGKKLGNPKNRPGYVASQTLINHGQGIMLFIVNAQSILVDWITKRSDGFTKKGIANFRKKNNLLMAPQEYDEVAGGIMTQVANQEKNVVEGVALAGDRIVGKGKEIAQVGIYNTAEVVFDSSFRNEAILKSIQDITFTSTEKELDEFIAAKMKEGTRDDYLLDIQRRAEEHYLIRNANNISVAEGKFLYGNPYSIAGKVKKELGRAYHFLSAWGNQHIRNYLRMFNNGWANVKQLHAELVVSQGPKEADRMVMQFVNNNKDIVSFTQKLFTAMSIGDKLQRMERDPDENPGFFERMEDATRLGLNFFAGAQGFVSSSLGRTIMSTIEGALLDDGVEQIEINDALAMAYMGTQAVMQNLQRRFLTINSFVKALGTRSATIENENIEQTFLKDFLENRTEDTEGFTFFTAEDVMGGGYFGGTLPQNYATDNAALWPDLNEWKQERQKQTTLEKLMKFEQRFNDDPMNAMSRFAMYTLPLMKQYNLGAFEKTAGEQEVFIDFRQKQAAVELSEGKFPEGRQNNEEDVNYLFTILTNMGGHTSRKDKVMWDGTEESTHNYDFTQDYITTFGGFKRDLTDKEHVFVKNLLEGLKPEHMESFLKEFRATDDNDVKTGIKLMGVIQSLEDETDTPGAARLFIGDLAYYEMWNIYNKRTYDAGYRKGDTVPEEIRDEWILDAKRQVLEDFGETLYVTDVPTWSMNVAGYYARKLLPEHEQRFVGGDIKAGDVDEEGNSLDWMRTYYPVEFRYDTNKYKDMNSTRLFKSDRYVSMELENGNYRAMDIQNAMNTIRAPSNTTEASDPDYIRIMVAGLQYNRDKINNSAIPEDAKQSLNEGLLKFLSDQLSIIESKEELIEILGEDTYNDTCKRLYGTAVASAKFDRSQVLGQGLNMAFRSAQKGGREGPEGPTGTVMDKYDKDGDYWTSLYSNGGSYKKNYYKNSSYSKSLRTYAANNKLYAKQFGSYGGGKNYYNANRSAFLKYYYYFRDAKSKGVAVGTGKGKVSRNFRTKITKLRVPKQKS